ncbi:MAG: glycoside hydrolase family 43 protein [Actinomycetota bacterium]|nr:glycoside hydrolase family 43 protein [Actinomycetota bacterium]
MNALAARRLLGGMLVALVVAGCSSTPSGPSSTAGGGAAASSSAGSAAGSAVPSAGPGQFTNPVYADDFPDPAVLAVGATFHAYGTQGGGANIQTLTSKDLVHWTKGSDALPTVGKWASAGNTWAPEVLKVGAGYQMFYVARDNASDKQCVGRATSKDPAGPFTDTSAKAFVCQPEIGGSIDPNPVKDADGSLYLYWKNDGNCCGAKVQLWGQRLTPDASALTGKRVALMSNTKPWQGNLVEAPEMLGHQGSHILLYSASNYASTDYAVGYASCAGPLGPCVDKSETPLLASSDQAAGPGHCFPITLANGSTWLIYHAWQPDAIGSTSPGRQLWLDPLRWKGSVPMVAGPTAAPQTDPVISG